MFTTVLASLVVLTLGHDVELHLHIVNKNSEVECETTVLEATKTLNCSVYDNNAFNIIIITGWRFPYAEEIGYTNQMDTIRKAMKYILTHNPKTGGENFNIVTIRANTGSFYIDNYKDDDSPPVVYGKIKPLLNVAEKLLLENHTGLTRVIGESFGAYSMRHFGEAHLNRTGKKLSEGHTIDPVLHLVPDFEKEFPKTYFKYYEHSQTIYSSTAGYFGGLFSIVKNYGDEVANMTVRLNGGKSYMSNCILSHYGDPRNTFVSGETVVNLCGFNFTYFRRISNFQCSHQFIWVWYVNSMWKQAYCLTGDKAHPIGFYTNSSDKLDCVTTESDLLPDTVILQRKSLDPQVLVGQGLWYRPELYLAPWVSSINGVINGWVSSIFYKKMGYKNNLEVSSYLDVEKFYVLGRDKINSTRSISSKNFELSYSSKTKSWGGYWNYHKLVGVEEPPGYKICLNR